METLITAMQSLCAVGLIAGIALSLYQAARPCSRTRAFDYAIANDFETGHRRWARKRR